jgi:hypothetical protein
MADPMADETRDGDDRRPPTTSPRADRTSGCPAEAEPRPDEETTDAVWIDWLDPHPFG